MSRSKPGPISAAARRSAEAELRVLITRLAPDHRKLVNAVRRLLRRRLPAANELVYAYRDCIVISYSPSERGHEGVLALRASAQDVRLYFNRAKGLSDPEKRLRGSGVQARWVAVEALSTLNLPAVTSLMDKAIARHHVPLERDGRGEIVIRPTSASQSGAGPKRTRRRGATKRPARARSSVARTRKTR